MAGSQPRGADRRRHLEGGRHAFGAWKTRGFRSELVSFEIPAEN
jgi:hypothetical protein